MSEQFDIVRARLRSHAQRKSKRDLWTCFSVVEVFDNVRREEIQELEGLLRRIYRSTAGRPRRTATRSVIRAPRLLLETVRLGATTSECRPQLQDSGNVRLEGLPLQPAERAVGPLSSCLACAQAISMIGGSDLRVRFGTVL